MNGRRIGPRLAWRSLWKSPSFTVAAVAVAPAARYLPTRHGARFEPASVLREV